ncbi:dihydroxyacetone kinase-like protein [Kineococcus xinjiangensis]|uniref:Dihydroxyacetone kinase-like protein n=1 Tax=Kineococcus xinjiangensis TaxID=512762 RepID=A0A2S6IC96_9ACTN|nr:dihydroxyacetone kinase subunit DhaK [Kineococcus xinjiangensis]PPK90807.1 dihydroxyacetone kinase-like protein [Kineococcus xinjiangensis]
MAQEAAVTAGPRSGARRQFLNDPDDVVAEALEGFARAHSDLVRWNRDPSYVIRADHGAHGSKVGLVSGGGSGHEPLHTGFVGRGMLDAAVPGQVFTSPTALQVAAATQAVDTGAGVVQIVKNYTGDVLNFRIAAEIAQDEGARVQQVLVDDDLATDPQLTGNPDGPGRRGTAAVVAVEKVCGAAAEAGADVVEVAALGRRVASSARSLAVALEAPAHPGRDRPSFDLGEHEVEFGVGIHGERGVGRRPFAPAAELLPQLTAPLVESLGLRRGDAALVIVNGLGSTHPLQLSLAYREVTRLLDGLGITTARSLLGSYVTALDMTGCSVTLVRLDDDLLRLWDAPVRTAALTW